MTHQGPGARRRRFESVEPDAALCGGERVGDVGSETTLSDAAQADVPATGAQCGSATRSA